MDYIEQFKNELSFSNLSKDTLYLYVQTVKRYLECTGGNPGFTRDEVIGFSNSLGNVTNTYKNWSLRTLKRFYEALGKPWPMRKREGPRVEERPQPYLKSEEVASLLEASKDNKRDHAIMQLFVDTLMRRDELFNLNRSDYNNGELQIKLSKGESYRTIRLSPEAKKALDAYLKTRQDANPALFVNDRRERLSKQRIYLMVKGYLSELGLFKPRLGSHGFRRGGVTDLVKKGVPPMIIQTWGGWKTLTMVSRYSQLTTTDVDATVRKMNPLRS